MTNTEFRTGVIRPVECFREGWELIKDRYWLFFAISLVGFLIAGFVPLCVLVGPMFCGIYAPLAERYRGGEPRFEQLFEGFKYFVPSLVATLVWALPLQGGFVIGYLPLVGAQLATDPRNPDPEIIFGALAFFGVVIAAVLLIWIFIHPFLMLTYQIVLEQKLSGGAALKLGARAVWHNLGGMVGLLVLNVLAYSVGMLLCGFGAYFALPLIFANTYVAYKKIFPDQGRPDDGPPPPDYYRAI